jgi:hypothetical protein
MALTRLRGLLAAVLASLTLTTVAAPASPFPQTTEGMTVLEFTRACRLSDKACWVAMDQTMDRLRDRENGSAFCLPKSFTFFSSQTVYSVALLDTWAQMVMAERFGRSERLFDDILIEKVAGMYPCRKAEK